MAVRSEGLGLGVHVVDQINHSVAVAELVVVPGDELHEGAGQLDSSLGIKDGWPRVPKEVSGDNHVLGVPEDSW